MGRARAGVRGYRDDRDAGSDGLYLYATSGAAPGGIGHHPAPAPPRPGTRHRHRPGTTLAPPRPCTAPPLHCPAPAAVMQRCRHRRHQAAPHTGLATALPQVPAQRPRFSDTAAAGGDFGVRILSDPGRSRVSWGPTHLWDPTHWPPRDRRQLRGRVSRRTIRGRDQRATGEYGERRQPRFGTKRARAVSSPIIAFGRHCGGSPASHPGDKPGAVRAETPWLTPGVIHKTGLSSTELRRHGLCAAWDRGITRQYSAPTRHAPPPPERKATRYSLKDSME